MSVPVLTRLFFSVVVLAFACGQPPVLPTPDSPAPAPVPEAFQEGSVSKSLEEIKSRSYGGSAVEKLFAEALEKDTALAHLLARWEATAPAFAEHLEPFNAFDLNNTDYYNDAEGRANMLTDSILKHGVVERIGASRDNYNVSVVPYRKSIVQHNAIAEQVRDLVSVIELERTLAMVEVYQRGNMPDRKLLDADIVALTALRDALWKKLKP